MSDSTLSQAIKEAYASAPSDVVIVDTLELRHPAFTEPIRVVADYAPIQARLEPSALQNPNEVVTFIPFAFSLKRPEVFDKGVPELEFSIDNVSGEIIDQIELAMSVPEKLEITYRAFLSNDLLSGPQNDPPITMTITFIEIDVMTISARASIVDFANKKFPNNEYDERTYPGLITD